MAPIRQIVVRTLSLAALLAMSPALMSAQTPTGTLAGRVSPAGQPVGSAIVASAGRATQTRADGSYRLVLPAGRHESASR
jgi:hypothetical protein